VKVKIPESYIKQIRKGQKVRITVEAFPDQKLEGEVTRVGVLPDSRNRWMSPDLKVYLTTITIEETKPWLKPGMTTKVEIMVDRLPEVIYVPVQSVTPLDGKQVCHVVSGGKTRPREVEIGQFNDEFIEIKKGLKEGERVLLRPPEAAAQEGGARKKASEGEKTKSPPPTSAPPRA
jgi:HlyD family secretion protein